MTESQPTLEEMKDYLQGAGLYEDAMPEKEVRNYYKVVRSSLNTADEESKQRKIMSDAEKNMNDMKNLAFSKSTSKDAKSDEDTDCEPYTAAKREKPFTPRGWSSQRRSQAPEDTSAMEVDEPQPKDKVVQSETKRIINVFDCPENNLEPLPQVERNPQYEEPAYCRIARMNLSFDEKAKQIAAFNQMLQQHYYAYQRTSIHAAPWGRQIQTSAKFNGSLCKQVFNLDDDEEEEVAMPPTVEEQPYVSRTGRVTKRTVYLDALNFEEDSSKQSKKRVDEVYMPEGPSRKRAGHKLTNLEITKKSKLFADSPKTTRAEKMFDKLADENKVRKSKEREIDKFHESLSHLSDDDDDFYSSERKEVVTTKRRIVPPKRGNKNVEASQGPSSSNEAAKADSKKRDNIDEDSSVSSSQDSVQAFEPLRRKSLKSTMNCPICQRDFPSSVIESHAATCTVESQATHKPPRSLTCKNCDQTFLISSLYEDHVSQCASKGHTDLQRI